MRRLGFRDAISVAILALSFIGFVGCGSSSREFEMVELATCYRHYLRATKHCPPDVDTLEKKELQSGNLLQKDGPLKSALARIRNGDIVVVWNADDLPTGIVVDEGNLRQNAVWAWEKITPEKGGRVIVWDGQVKYMTATDFANASKAPSSTKTE